MFFLGGDNADDETHHSRSAKEQQQKLDGRGPRWVEAIDYYSEGTYVGRDVATCPSSSCCSLVYPKWTGMEVSAPSFGGEARTKLIPWLFSPPPMRKGHIATIT